MVSVGRGSSVGKDYRKHLVPLPVKAHRGGSLGNERVVLWNEKNNRRGRGLGLDWTDNWTREGI